MIDTAQGRL